MANISMKEVPLICHQHSDAGGVESVEVTIARGQSGEIRIVYRVCGAHDLLDIAAPAKPDRVDALWKNTCFEIFIGNYEDDTYVEYNFAPSSQWAAYRFSDYRLDMKELETNIPNINVEQNSNVFTVSVTLALPDAWRERDLRAGIGAVVATKSGDISYWAAAHPPGKPDFHHKDCFAVQLEARSAA